MTPLKISGSVYLEGPLNFSPMKFDHLPDEPYYMLVMTPTQIKQLRASPDFTFNTNQDKRHAEANQ